MSFFQFGINKDLDEKEDLIKKLKETPPAMLQVAPPPGAAPSSSSGEDSSFLLNGVAMFPVAAMAGAMNRAGSFVVGGGTGPSSYLALAGGTAPPANNASHVEMTWELVDKQVVNNHSPRDAVLLEQRHVENDWIWELVDESQVE